MNDKSIAEDIVNNGRQYSDIDYQRIIEIHANEFGHIDLRQFLQSEIDGAKREYELYGSEEKKKKWDITTLLGHKSWYNIKQYHLSRLNYLTEKIKAMQESETITTPELDTIVNKYVLLDQLGIIQFLKDKHGFDEMKQTGKIALLSMILGLDKKGEHSIKGILSSPRPTDKNYPLKDKNIKTVQSKLTELGIMKVKPVKGLQNR